MKTLGTILATKEQLATADRHSDKMRVAALLLADKELKGMSKRTVNGEVRYYKTPVIYTPAISKGVRRWFEVREDGDYAIPA